MSLSVAAPKVTAWSTPNLTSGKLDLGKGNPPITYSFSREAINDVWEYVEMELVFFVVFNNKEINVFEESIFSLHFNSNSGYGSKTRTIGGLTQYIGGVLRAKYRVRNSQSSSFGSWIPVGSKSLDIVDYSSTSSITNGVFVNNTTTGEVSIMFEGKLRHIQHMETLVGLFNVRIPGDLRNFSSAQLASVPKGEVLGPDNNIIQSNNVMYLREGNLLRHIGSPTVLQKYKFNSHAIKIVSTLPSHYIIGLPILE